MKTVVKLRGLSQRLSGLINRRRLPKFATFPKDLVIQQPYQISNADRIYMGDSVKLGANSVLKLNLRYPGAWLRHPTERHVSQTFTPKLTIGDRVTATSALQIAVFSEIIIEDDVMFASNVFVCDGMHGYAKADIPYKYQGIERISPIAIKRGSWISQNVVVLPGVTIGEYAIVGANSVVTHSIPDRCIAVGAPAHVIKRWDEESQTWRPVTPVEVQDS